MALLRQMTCNLRHPVGLRHPVYINFLMCFVYVCMHICMYVWMHVCIFLYFNQQIDVCTSLRICLHSCLHVSIDAHVCIFHQLLDAWMYVCFKTRALNACMDIHNIYHFRRSFLSLALAMRVKRRSGNMSGSISSKSFVVLTPLALISCALVKGSLYYFMYHCHRWICVIFMSCPFSVWFIRVLFMIESPSRWLHG